MAEKEKIFSSSIKYSGIFSFKDFYKFCYEWLREEAGIEMNETAYEEKIKGNEKEIKVNWEGGRKMTDYFKAEISVSISASPLRNVEITQGGAKISTNEGSVRISIGGTLVRDYEGKFEMSAFNKFLRGIYEKWVIKSRIEEYEGKVAGMCDEFLSQGKAYLDLEGKK